MPAFRKHPGLSNYWNISVLFILFIGMINAESAFASDTIAAKKFHDIADSLFTNKKYDAALANYKQAADLYHTFNAWEQEVICLNAEANAFRKLRKYDMAIDIFNKSIDLGLIHLDETNEAPATSFHLKSLCYWAKGDYYQVIFLEQMAIKRWKLIFGENSYQVAKGYNNVGLCYKNTGKYNKALDFYKYALKTFALVLDSLDPRLARTINNISFAYQKLGDYDQALGFSKNAIAIALKQQPVDSLSLMKKYNNLGLLYYRMDSNGIAQDYLEKGLHIRLKYLSKNHPDIADSYNNLGMINRRNGQPDKALAYYNKALHIYRDIYDDHHPDVARCYYNIGNVYMEIKEYNKALDFYEKALSIRSAIYREPHPDIAACYLNLGSLYKTLGEYDKALGFLQKASTSNTYKNQFIDYRAQLAILNEKAAIYTLRNQQLPHDTNDLIQAVNVYKSICSLIDEQRKSYHSKGSMLALSNEVSDNYKEAVKVAHELYQLTGNKIYLYDAFYFAEKNKANVLVEAILQSRSQTYSGILDSLIEKEKTIKQKLQVCDEQRKDEIFNKGKRNAGKIEVIEKEFARLSRSYDSLIVIFEKNYQRYYRLRYNTSAMAAPDVQQLLTGNETLIEYMLSDSTLFIFTISPNEIALTNINAINLDTSVMNLRKSLSMLAIDKLNSSSIAIYCVNALHLFNLLIKTVEDKIAGRDLIIVPDGKLGYIPFEVLLTDSVNKTSLNFKKLPYLIQKYSISYGNSASIQFDLLNSLHSDAKENFLGIAPFAHADYRTNTLNDTISGHLSGLPSSKQELETIQNLIGGRVYEDSAATLQNFLKEAPKHKILHIATHGVVDDKHPLESCLYFYPDGTDEGQTLKIHDLFSLSFNSELAVLSACNTGNGKLEGGEGIMSLARGFSYAGVPGIAMSLWNVNDKSTAFIMDRFYEHLRSGYSKNEALRLAKLDYLDQSDQLLASPYYWGGFIFIGKNDKIGFEGNMWNYWLLLIIVPILGGGIYYLRRKKRSVHID